MKRGTATILLVGGTLVLLAAMGLFSATITARGTDCGSAMSPRSVDRYDFGGDTFGWIITKETCTRLAKDRKIYAAMAAIGGVTMLGIGAWGLNNTVPTEGVSEPQAAGPDVQPT